jgi:hypothetical protein
MDFLQEFVVSTEMSVLSSILRQLNATEYLLKVNEAPTKAAAEVDSASSALQVLAITAELHGLLRDEEAALQALAEANEEVEARVAEAAQAKAALEAYLAANPTE